MQFRYLNWYTQALGATLGILSCMFGYLNGYMFVFINDPSKYIESIGILGVISSYMLFPLCILTLILALIRSYTLEINKKEIFGFSFLYLNDKISFLTVLFGLIGTRYFFIIPAMLIVFNKYSHKFIKHTENNNEEFDNSTLDANYNKSGICENISEKIAEDLILEENIELNSNESNKEFT